jgi:hypothetical protein
MLVGDDAIRENIQLSFYQKGNNNSAKGTLSTCRGGLFYLTPGEYSRSGAGRYPGVGRFPEGRITKAVIECQIGQAGGNIYASSHGTATAKLGQFVGFVANRLIIQFRHQQPPTAMNQIM